MEYEEWSDLATAFRSLCAESGIPAGIGCTWTNQAGALRRVGRAVELGYHNIHLSQPYWLRMNDAARKEFWSAVSEHAGSAIRIVVYSGSHTQLPLGGNVMMRLRGYCPAIAGTKYKGFDSLPVNRLLSQSTGLLHLVG